MPDVAVPEPTGSSENGSKPDVPGLPRPVADNEPKKSEINTGVLNEGSRRPTAAHDHAARARQLEHDKEQLVACLLEGARARQALSLPDGITTLDQLDLVQVNVGALLAQLRSSEGRVVVPTDWVRRSHEPCKATPAAPIAATLAPLRHRPAPPLPPRKPLVEPPSSTVPLLGLDHGPHVPASAPAPAPVPAPAPAPVPANLAPIPVRQPQPQSVPPSPRTLELPRSPLPLVFRDHLWVDPVQFVYPTFREQARVDLGTRFGHRWPFSTFASHPLSLDHLNQAAFEVLMFATRHHARTSLTMRVVMDHFRPLLDVSLRRHRLTEDLVLDIARSDRACADLTAFRVALLATADPHVFASGVEESDWRRRQVDTLLNDVGFALVHQPPEWNDLVQVLDAACVLPIDQGRAGALLESIQDPHRLRSANHYARTILYERLLACCVDLNEPWHMLTSDANVTAVLTEAKSALGITDVAHHYASAKVFYTEYCKHGCVEALDVAHRELHDALSMDASIEVSYVGQLTLVELESCLQRTISSLHAWPMSRMPDFDLLAALLDEIENPRAVMPTRLSIGIALDQQQPVPANRSTLRQLVTESKKQQCGNLRADLEQVKVDVPVLVECARKLREGVVADWTLRWPIMQRAMSPSAWSAAIVDVALAFLATDVLHPLPPMRVDMSQAVVDLMKEVADLEALCVSIKNEILPAYKDKPLRSLGLHTTFESITLSWVRGQSSFLTRIAERAFFADDWSGPADDVVLHTESIITVFNGFHSFVSMFFALPFLTLNELAILPTIGVLRVALDRYFKLCATVGLPTINTDFAHAVVAEPSNALTISRIQDSVRRASSASNLLGVVGGGGSGSSGAPLIPLGPDIGVPEMALRINNVMFAAEHLSDLIDLIRSKCDARGRLAQFLWLNVWTRHRTVLAHVMDVLINRLVATLVFRDLRSVFVDALYLPVAQRMTLRTVLPHLDQKADLEGLLVPEIAPRVVERYAVLVLDTVRRVFLDPTSARVFHELDYSAVVDPDLEALDAFVQPYFGELVPTAYDAFLKWKEAVAVLMPMPPPILIGAYDALLDDAEGRQPATAGTLSRNTAPMPSDPDHPLSEHFVRAMLCHRMDPACRAYVKKQKLHRGGGAPVHARAKS
ncbi:hypothetical protein AMAG_07187 [Allomyces macrogynus ATCC 38327]|uniref:PATROL1-like C-terminal domain-containing protein n=1 Tax=Allomyces macrogynus (strain ATCC 38327) TaxID=578462 RepID=A0A0L0SHC9_ALLM3|nr:hypothetical protein AMAG_07187 [Allomyces macrogynus ATCC 38327]|eukprot:KNE61918.1 hypothetical protein AMAG_07187 [Allomyces macrogynus ATCC 38327]